MRTKRLGRWALVALLLLAGICGQAAADSNSQYVIQKKGNTTIKYKRKNSYNFEGASIDGLYNKPSGSYISSIKEVRARTIIGMRKNFDAEVIDSARWIE